MTKPQDTTAEITRLTATTGVRRPSAKEEAVIVNFEYRRKDWLPFFKFQDDLIQTIEVTRVGQYDGNELPDNGRECAMYIYGPDANAILAVIAPILRSTSLLARVIVTVRYAR